MDLSIYGDGVLRAKSRKVEEFGKELCPFLEEMIETMSTEGGVGLAAPQVGLSKRIIVANEEPDNRSTVVKMINPKIITLSNDVNTVEEGCLSIPGIHGDVVRPTSIVVHFQDENGVERELEAEGLLARIIQHEIDHLNGILFIDHLSVAKKMLIKPQLRRLKNGSDRG